MNVFGQRVRARLKGVGRTQRWLATQSGVAEQIISNLVNDRYENPGSIGHAVPFARALNTTVDYLFGVVPYPEKPLYPSAVVRQIAQLAERLPSADQQALLVDLRKRVEETRQEAWRAELEGAVARLVERYGDEEAAMRALDSLFIEAAETDDLPLFQEAEAPSC